MAHLKSIPGGVLTLKLPPVESADPVDLARQIREMLTGVPAPRSRDCRLRRRRKLNRCLRGPTSPHLLAAAAAAINWIRTRRAQWSDVRRRFRARPSQWAGASAGSTNRSNSRTLRTPMNQRPLPTNRRAHQPTTREPEDAPLIKSGVSPPSGRPGGRPRHCRRLLSIGRRFAASSAAPPHASTAAVQKPVEVTRNPSCPSRPQSRTRSVLESVRMGCGGSRRSTSSSARAAAGFRSTSRAGDALAGKAQAALSESRARIRRDAHGRSETGGNDDDQSDSSKRRSA